MAKQNTDRHTPLRPLRIPDDEWEALGQAVGDRERTRLIREYIRWHLRWPGNTQPTRAKEQVGGPGISSKSNQGAEPGRARSSARITTNGSDRYHASEDCPMFQAGRRSSEAQGSRLLPIRPLTRREVERGRWTPCPGCVGEADGQ